MYPVVDLTNRHGIRQQNRMDSFITRRIVQQTRDAVPHVFEDGSPTAWIHREGVAAAAPPFCIVQGTHDSLVWVEEVRRFVAEFSPLTSHRWFTRNCSGRSTPSRSSIHRAPAIFSMPLRSGWSGCVRGRVTVTHPPG